MRNNAQPTVDTFHTPYMAARALSIPIGMAASQQQKRTRHSYSASYDQLRVCFSLKLLSNTFLPPNVEIKNLMLIVCALEDWDDADMFWLSAEMVYNDTLA
ncbi:uncharacterized protein M421DRAFT_418861 [Didymella exigua CBS 183.55]|uniref:Uncharacterized protein n=1 Tax=Didymella exigua CBS 183.55 TaxID=1150837 RepID=A0A6A5RSI3_9PLEO|nr:uncharacterized protein M421DRAFT_418861 [Didymella exigua CBS 183.55]KAF1930559.1 hypothetical protein M421DRAFT_418861 [Didymella exigua CBS 183.55]